MIKTICIYCASSTQIDPVYFDHARLLGIRNCPMSLHLKQLAGKNAHHIAEGAFKALARALKAAVAQDGSGEIPSTKGVL